MLSPNPIIAAEKRVVDDVVLDGADPDDLDQGEVVVDGNGPGAVG
jgi:hypothetical protein